MSHPQGPPRDNRVPGPAGQQPEGYEITLGQPPRPARPGGPSYARPPEKTSPPAKGQVGDSGLRETIETVVFVVVLVLLLKTFLAEAFVIPTGSMATTLLGYHGEETCQKCGYRYVFNASTAVEPQRGRPQQIIGSWCENCQAFNPRGSELPANRRPAGGGDQ